MDLMVMLETVMVLMETIMVSDGLLMIWVLLVGCKTQSKLLGILYCFKQLILHNSVCYKNV